MAGLGDVDASAVADCLVGTFGSLREVIAAPPSAIYGVVEDSRVARFVGVIRSALIWALVSEARDRPRIDSLDDLLPLLRATIGEEGCEYVLLLMLDTERRLIRAEAVGRGDHGEAPICVHDIVARCLAAGAAGIIIAHNHPSDSFEPSRADKDVTYSIGWAIRALRIYFLDHVIVTRSGHYSFRSNGLI